MEFVHSEQNVMKKFLHLAILTKKEQIWYSIGSRGLSANKKKGDCSDDEEKVTCMCSI